MRNDETGDEMYEEWRGLLSDDVKKLISLLIKKGCWNKEYYQIFGNDIEFMEDIKFYCYPIFAVKPNDSRWIKKCLRYCFEHMKGLDNDTKQAFCSVTGECAASNLSYDAYEKLLDDNIRRGIQVDINTLRVFYKGNVRVKKDEEVIETVEKIKDQLDEVKRENVYEKLEETEKRLKEALNEIEQMKAGQESEISKVKAAFADKVLEYFNERGGESRIEEVETVRQENEKLHQEIVRLKGELEQFQCALSGCDEVASLKKGVNNFLLKKRFQNADQGNQKRIILHVLLSKKYNASCIRGVTEAINNGGNLDMLFQLVLDSSSNNELITAIKVFLSEEASDEKKDAVREMVEGRTDNTETEFEELEKENDFFEEENDDSEFQDFEY